jgi:hypothetical protein
MFPRVRVTLGHPKKRLGIWGGFVMNLIIKTLVSSVLVLSVVNAQGFEELGHFQTPSGNIFCVADLDRIALNTTLRCDLKENTAKIPARPQDCDLDWGNSFIMSDQGKARRNCHGDTVQNPNYKKLEYGKKWSEGGFTCDVSKVRLRCVNRDKHGFELAKAAQKIF